MWYSLASGNESFPVFPVIFYRDSREPSWVCVVHARAERLQYNEKREKHFLVNYCILTVIIGLCH